MSCTSATGCTAVGNYGIHAICPLALGTCTARALIERWNGRRWSIQQTPQPAGATQSDLSGVSCASGTSCTAVGFFTNGADQQVTFAERWN